MSASGMSDHIKYWWDISRNGQCQTYASLLTPNMTSSNSKRKESNKKSSQRYYEKCVFLLIQLWLYSPHSLPEIKKQRKKRCLNAWESFGSTGCVVPAAYSAPISLILFQGCWENYSRAQGGSWCWFERRVAQGIPPCFTYWWRHVRCRQQWEIGYTRPPPLANAQVSVGNKLMLYWISTLITA